MKILVITELEMMRLLMERTFSKYDCDLDYLPYDKGIIRLALEQDDEALIIIEERDSTFETVDFIDYILTIETMIKSPSLKCILIRKENSYDSIELEHYKKFIIEGKLLVLIPDNLSKNLMLFYENLQWDCHPIMTQARKVRSDFTVLLIDKDPQKRLLLSRLFESNGLKLLVAENDTMGWNMYLQFAPHIVITESDLPDLSGIELCRKIKAYNSYTKVIILSNLIHETIIDLTCAAGADDYLLKPIDSVLLMAKIETLIEMFIIKSDFRVLIVDDSLTIQEGLGLEFKKNNMDVIFASNGMAGFSKAVIEKSSVVISDIEMPIMNGYELLSAIKSVKRLDQTTVIMMSGRFTQAHVNLKVNNTPVQFFPKPFDIHKLVIQTEQIIMGKSNQFKKDYENLIGSISALITALEARDEYTKGHSERVVEYALVIGKRLNFDHQKMLCLEMAAKLHDLGKIGIRDDILLKPGILSEDEFKIIQLHPALGAKILDSMDNLKAVAKVVKYHHEHFDGTGYPEQLSHKAIPIESRIIAVADTFDAITTSRPYRNVPFTLDAAKVLLTKEAGHQLCPLCVDAFLEEWEVIRNIKNQTLR